MANQKRLSNLMDFEVLEPSDIGRQTGIPMSSPHNPPDDIWKLQTDVINVLEGRVDISTFEPSYQEKIKTYYKFSGTAFMSSYTRTASMAPMIRSTMEIV